MGIALENGLVRTNEVFNCPARIKIADGFISEAYPKAMGKISTSDVLVKSSNVGMAQIGIRAKPVDMYRALLNWGFGKTSDIELGGAEKGILASPGQWRGVVPANISIGQGLAVTPLQLITATAAIVNGGELLSPYIVQEAVNSAGEVVYKGRKTVVREVLTPEICSWLRGAMRETVLSGTGRQAGTDVAQAAAKTGTAQVAEKGKYIKGRYVSSFVGFWPYEAPRYLMLIVIGEPSSGKYYGGELAAPMFKNIVESMAEWGIGREGA
jgi:cell division protein FtsI (penicillin-binding protein 3)/stage V sporulation protein D (sporulation-specific penicillin-binding protein)